MMDAVTLVSANPAWWLLAISLMVAGVAGAILPVLPGTLLVLAGVFVGAWIDGFTRVSGWTVGFIAVLALLAWATDYLAALLGAKKILANYGKGTEKLPVFKMPHLRGWAVAGGRAYLPAIGKHEGGSGECVVSTA